MNIYSIPKLVQGIIINRPSKQIKSPYVADVLLLASNQPTLAHTASLGCGGLSHTGANVYMLETEGNKCEHRIMISKVCYSNKIEPTYIGIYPKLAEELVANALRLNCLPNLQNITKMRRETTYHIEGEVNSRFDFSGIDETGREFVLEVKNVPLAHECVLNNGGQMTRKNVAYFPDGYRKNKNDPVSPRALKHVQEMQKLVEIQKIRAILCFVVQRDDVDAFELAATDPIYKNAVNEAYANGVEVVVLHVHWKLNANEDNASFCANAFCSLSELPIDW